MMEERTHPIATNGDPEICTLKVVLPKLAGLVLQEFPRYTTLGVYTVFNGFPEIGKRRIIDTDVRPCHIGV